MRMLCWLCPSPRNTSNRLPGGTHESSICFAAAIIRSFALPHGWIRKGSPQTA
jgi:hypothetical protein